MRSITALGSDLHGLRYNIPNALTLAAKRAMRASSRIESRLFHIKTEPNQHASATLAGGEDARLSDSVRRSIISNAAHWVRVRLVAKAPTALLLVGGLISWLRQPTLRRMDVGPNW